MSAADKDVMDAISGISSGTPGLVDIAMLKKQMEMAQVHNEKLLEALPPPPQQTSQVDLRA